MKSKATSTQYWLLKSEPETFSWVDLCRRGKDMWDGVRNYQARNHLRSMKVSDLAFFYHSGKEKAIQGITKVVREHYPDPTTKEPHSWVVVDITCVEALPIPITLSQLREERALSEMVLLNNPRLSVQPVQESEFLHILALSKNIIK